VCPTLARRSPSILSANRPGPNQLITIWGAAADFINEGQTDPAVPVTNLAAAITALADAGGKNFIVANLPRLGSYLPPTLVQPSLDLSPSGRQALDSLTLAYDAQLAAQLDRLGANLGISVHLLDIDAIIQEVRADPARFGFTNVTDAALDDGVISGQGYFIYDSTPGHPTTQAHLLFADQAFASVVPEPPSLVLLTTGLSTAVVGLILWRRGRLPSLKALTPSPH
jgi:phospholipase/lecithinase/hemolysin